MNLAISWLSLSSDHADTAYIQGLCFYFEGQLSESINQLNHILHLDPEHQKTKSILPQIESLRALKMKGNSSEKEFQWKIEN